MYRGFLGGGGFGAVAGVWAWGEADDHGFEDDVEDGDKEKVEEGGDHHASNDGGADRVASEGSGAGGEVEGHDAEDEGDRGHEDGAKAELGGDDGSVDDALAVFELLLGELDDEDGVFGGEADEHDQADLNVDVVDQAARRDQRERAEDRHGDGEQDDEGQREALVLGGESEIDDEQAEAEDDDGFAGGFHLFEGEAGPGVGHALDLVLVEEALHGFEALSGAEAGCGRAVDLGGAEEIVVIDDLRAGALLQADDVVEGNHLAGVGADVVLSEIGRGAAILLVGLNVDAVGAVVEVEVVDVAGAHEGAEGGGYLGEGDAHGLGLLAVDGDEICGSLEVKVVFMPVRPEPGRGPCRRGLGDAVMSPKVLRPASCRMNWNPPTVPIPSMAGGSAAKAMPPGMPKSLRTDSATMLWRCILGPSWCGR